MSISLCMIVKNEEKYLDKCINSIKKIMDEIIIVDTGSKDKTKEIPKKFTKKIYHFKWNDNFSEARNFSIKKATKEWILVLDADETISKNDLKKIKELTENNTDNKKLIGFSFIQRTYSDKISKLKWNYSKDDLYIESKPYKGWNYRRITRLFKNNKKIKFIYPVHETVIESIKNLDGKIINTDIPIHHFKILKGKKSINKQSNQYIKLLKNKIRLYPKAKFYFELAIELKRLNKNKEAKRYFKKAIKLNPIYRELVATLI